MSLLENELETPIAHLVAENAKLKSLLSDMQARPHRKLFEIRATVEYAVVIAAETRQAALEHVKTWEHTWDSCSDLLGVSPPDVVDVREPRSQEDLEDEAHEVV